MSSLGMYLFWLFLYNFWHLFSQKVAPAAVFFIYVFFWQKSQNGSWWWGWIWIFFFFALVYSIFSNNELIFWNAPPPTGLGWAKSQVSDSDFCSACPPICSLRSELFGDGQLLPKRDLQHGNSQKWKEIRPAPWSLPSPTVGSVFPSSPFSPSVPALGHGSWHSEKVIKMVLKIYSSWVPCPQSKISKQTESCNIQYTKFVFLLFKGIATPPNIGSKKQARDRANGRTIFLGLPKSRRGGGAGLQDHHTPTTPFRISGSANF